MRTTLVFLRAGTWVRRSSPLRHLEPFWARVQPWWDSGLGKATRDRGIVVSVNGDAVRLVPAYAAYHASREYEPEVHAVLASKITPGMCVFDVGAHVGLFTLAAAFRVGENGHVVAFEPSPPTLASLHLHISLNGFDDIVEVVPAAVGKEEGETAFFLSGETMSASVTRASVDELRPGHEASAVDVREIRVPVVTLDGFAAQRRIRPDVVKIDVEGAELQVLRGAPEILDSDAEVICEIHPAQLKALGDSEDELIEWVSQRGRALTRIDERSDGIYHALLTKR